MAIFLAIYAAFLLHEQITYCQSQQIVPSINSNFNQPCTHQSQCNNNAGLYCVTSSFGQQRCNCPTNSTIFDEYQGRCVGRVGSPCVYQENQSFCPEKALCSHQDPHHPDLFFYESRCFCELNYFGDKDGKCVLAAKHGDPCSASSNGKKCDEVSGLKCIEGKCACAFGKDNQYYNAKKDKCISYLNKNCSGFNSCTENARCDGSSVNRATTKTVPILRDENENGNIRRKRQGSGGAGLPPPLFPIPFARSIDPTNVGGRFASIGRNGSNSNNLGSLQEPQDQLKRKFELQDNEPGLVHISVGKCVCDYGFTGTKNGKCLAGYKQLCSRTQKCNHEDNLECLDGSCACKSPLHQVYDQSLKKCTSLVDAKCDLKSQLCTENAHCVHSVCSCKEGYSRTPHRRCMLGYGKSCENGECNMYNGLTCKSNSNNEKKCSCVDDTLVYNEKLESCVSKIGFPCGHFPTIGEHYVNAIYVPCEPSAVCEQKSGDKNNRFCKETGKEL